LILFKFLEVDEDVSCYV